MLKTNKQKLPVVAMGGGVASSNSYFMVRDVNGYEHPRVQTGSIVYNFKIGDNCWDIVGEHIAPGVCSKAMDKCNYDSYGCIGNRVIVAMGAAANAEGYVIGKLGGGILSLWFPEETMQKLRLTDQFLVYTCGVGLALEDHPEIVVMNTDPGLLEKLQIREDGPVLKVPVAATLPGCLVGAGMGTMTYSFTGDDDLSTSDRATALELGMDSLCFGDLVLITDYDMSMGTAYTEGAVTLAVVVHGNSIQTGHGIGVVPLMTSKKPLLEGIADSGANIGKYLGIC